MSLWSNKPSHICIVLRSSRLLDTFQVVNIEIFTWNASSSVIIRIACIWAILIVSCSLVFLENFYSIVDDFCQIGRNPFGILKNCQLVFYDFLAFFSVEIKRWTTVAFLAQIGRHTPVIRKLTDYADYSIEIWFFIRTRCQFFIDLREFCTIEIPVGEFREICVMRPGPAYFFIWIKLFVQIASCALLAVHIENGIRLLALDADLVIWVVERSW